MKTKALFLVVLLCTSITSALTGCSDEQIEPENTTETKEGKFTLYASVEEPDSRLAMEGLELKWEDGDKLYMVNTAGGDPIELVTSLSEPATTAVFSSENEVPEGTYYVMYNNQSFEFEQAQDYGTNEELADNIKLYSEPLVINAGDNSATIQLKHVYAKITFNLKNLEEPSAVTIGIGTEDGYFHTEGLLENGQMSVSGNEIVVGGAFDNNNWETDFAASILLFPTDLSGCKLHFFVSVFDGVYEIVKDGKDIQAGYNYNIDIDLGQVTYTEFEALGNFNYNVSTAEQFKALALKSYFQNRTDVNVLADIDFKDIDVFFPLDGEIEGNGHTFKNITINRPNINNIGILRTGSVNNLIVENVNIQGYDNVGALSGYGSITDCKLQGDNTIKGNDNVGGLSGKGSSFLSNNVVQAVVIGRNNVGGISGTGVYQIFDCISQGSVEGNDNVGGICGCAGDYYSECISYSSIKGNSRVGGIAGSGGDIVKCISNGNITGNSIVGGIIGANGNEISLSYSAGDVVANVEKAGGIMGESLRSSIVACYSLGNISAPLYAGGILGYKSSSSLLDTNISYCYSSGVISENGSGIGTAEQHLIITNCATTFKNIDSVVTEGHEDFINCNGTDKTIRSVLSKGEEFNTYYSSSKDWAVEDAGIAGCPIFLWQSGGIQIGTGDSGTKAPAFVDGGSF